MLFRRNSCLKLIKQDNHTVVSFLLINNITNSKGNRILIEKLILAKLVNKYTEFDFKTISQESTSIDPKGV
jgi:hypothetical protein